ncbi:MAG: DNA gyrase subunit A [Chloroflexi bacterium]|nr:DNA gyrase subunit A [Chloroflexota bacterium]MCL5076429.1 DNA gyrase subunit A [Chloroflexota bacterium]
MKIVKGPDFPTAGIILGQEGINSAYTTGHGRITIRSRAHIEEVKGGRYQIIITELPYQINKSSLLEKIAEMVHDRRLEGISELRDESDREGMRIVVELKRDAAPKQILNQLYKYTAMQSAFTVNMLALVDGQPRVLNLKAMLLHYLNHRREIVTRRTVFDLEKARQRLHILEGLKIALDHLDEVIATIRRAQDADTARVALIKNFHLSEIQAQAILDMQLRRLAALERKKIVNEYGDTIKLIAHLEDVLAHPVKILYLIRDELLEIKTKYGDARRTRIIAEEAADFSDEDLIPEQEVAIIISPKGYIRRLSSDIYHPQRRAARSSPPRVSWREEEPIQNLCIANTHDNVLFFSNRGRVYGLKAHQIPDSNRQSKGVPIGNLLALGEQETIVGSVALSTSDGDGYCLLITSGGQVKRVALKEYASTRPAGIIATDLPDRDELVKMVLTSGQDEVIIVTQKGQALRFREEEVRPSNRTSGGVRAIKLQAGDKVIGMDVVRPGLALLVITRNRYAKRVALSDFPTHGRGGGGVRVANITAKTGSIVGASVVWTTDELIITLSEGSAVRLPVDSIPLMSRTAQGTALADMGEGKGITSLIHLKGPGAILTEEPAPETDRGPLKKAKTKGSKMASTKAPTDKKEKTAVAATIPTKKTAPTKPAAKQTKKEEIKAATATVPPQKTIQAEPAAKQTKAEKMKVATATVPAKKMAQAKPAAKQAGTMPTAPEKSRKVAPGEAAGRAKSQSRAKTAVAKATPATSTASAQVKPSQGQVQRRSEPRSPQRAAAAEKPPKTSPPDSPKVKQPAKTKGKKRQAKSKQLTLFGAITAALRKTDKK